MTVIEIKSIIAHQAEIDRRIGEAMQIGEKIMESALVGDFEELKMLGEKLALVAGESGNNWREHPA